MTEHTSENPEHPAAPAPDEPSLFSIPSPTTTAAELRVRAEEFQARVLLRDTRMLDLLPNLISNYAIAICLASANSGGRSFSLRLRAEDIVKKIPEGAIAALGLGSPSEQCISCMKIMSSLCGQVGRILVDQGFACEVSFDGILMNIEIAW